MSAIASSSQPDEGRGVSIDVVDLSYSVVVKEKVKTLLRNVSFSIEPGGLTALMGPSGAGKSTLLDVLADRKLVGQWSGEVYVNKAPRSRFFCRDMAYVLQDDVHIATLTVSETIMYAAWTRMPEGTPREQLQQRVDQLLEMMSMSHVKDSVVGDGMHKGISGGQLKRLSIAVEIVSLPRLIFLDEPTSGLDSSISLEVMGVVRKLADQNRTCVATIHQPSPEVFALFDKVVLVSAGRLIYFGSSADVIPYFTQPALGYKYNGTQNPAEFMIDVSNGQIFPNDLKICRMPDELETLYKRTKFYIPPAKTGGFGTKATADANSPYTSEYATTPITHLKMLMQRSWLATVRDKRDMSAQIFKSIGVGVMIGIVFNGQAETTTPFYTLGVPNAEIANVSSLLFFAMAYCLTANMQAIPYLCLKNQIYQRELAAYAYAPAPYWFVASTVNLPILFLNHMLFTIIAYFVCGFPNNSSYFFYFMFILLFTNIISFNSAMFLAASTGSQTVAFAVFPIMFLFVTTFSGFSIAIEDVPAMWCWAPYLSYGRWIFEGLMVNQWGQFDTDDNTYGTGYGNVLSQYGFEGFDKNNAFWILLLYIIGISGMCYWAMQPPKKLLARVDDACDHDTVKKEDLRRRTLSVVSLKDNLSAVGIKENLLSSADADVENFSESLAPQTTYDVAWYRQSTGNVQLSRGCRLVFKDLQYSVHSKKDKKLMIPLLKGVSGRAHPGEMCALMGASGAGKSTLLDVLAGRKNTGELLGDILFNGAPRTLTIMKSAAYVMQDNVHIGVLTVRESLRFAAELRLKETLPAEAKEKRVQKILDMLGLEAVADTIVGDENTRGISGGQVKRLSIAVEIVSLPDLIFLDEPTTGLDSSIAYEVMAAVRNLANQNRTVVCTIHQPSPQTYLLFDKLMLLAEGRVIYFGPARDVVNYFVTSPYQFFYKPGSNPADFVIAVAGSFVFSSSGQKVSGGELAALYGSSELSKLFKENMDTMIAIDSAASATPEAGADEHTENDMEYNTSTLNQLKVLISRAALRIVKNRRPTAITVFRHVIVGFFYGTIYYQMPTGTDPTDYTNRLSVFFFALMFAVIGHQQSIPVLQEDRLMFYRERGSKAYGALSYWVSSWILQIPLAVLNILLFSMILYTLAGLRSGGGYFFYFYYIMLMCSLNGLFVCQLLAAISSSTQAALQLFPALLFFVLAFSGFIIYLPDFPPWLGSWAPYLSFLRYGFQGLVLNEFSNNTELPYESSYLDNLGFNSVSQSTCGGVLVLFLLMYAFSLLAALKYVDFEER